MLSSVEFFNMRSFFSMTLFGMVAYAAWRLTFYKNVPVDLKAIPHSVVKKTAALLLLPALAIIYFLYNADSIDYGILSLMVITSIATGIYEEFIFRAIGFGSLIAAKVKTRNAVFISAAVFALFHLPVAMGYMPIDTFFKLFTVFVMGIVFAYIYYITKNILYVIAIHILWDLATTLNLYYGTDTPGLLFALALFAVGLGYCFLGCRELKNEVI